MEITSYTPPVEKMINIKMSVREAEIFRMIIGDMSGCKVGEINKKYGHEQVKNMSDKEAGDVTYDFYNQLNTVLEKL